MVFRKKLSDFTAYSFTGHRNCKNGMAAVIWFVGETGIVESVYTSGDIKVNYKNPRNKKLRLNPAALEKISQWSVNDTVKILSDVEKVKTYQEDHGGWNSDMISVLGKTGIIKHVFPDGDLVVSVSGKIFLFNPLCCERVSGGMLSEEEDIEMPVPSLSMNSDFTDLLSFSQEDTEDSEIQEFDIGDTVMIIDDIQKVKEYQDGHGGWSKIMETILGEKAEVKLVLPNDDLLVLMPGSMWRLNPKCCENVSDSDESETSSDSDDWENSSYCDVSDYDT
ncbi:Hypothetical predicted protein [Octopus vulgaris]|uniref:Mind bomb SH3 repeat domain-containing protein n=1 Tax=Octopus vulgaris TaxID=6645 RepID=A0AA36BWK2_OCTVU|nr:Hypothetical predicted protein [Octopus vulgaris]